MNKIIANEKLKTIDGETLLSTAMKPIDFVIENIIPEGLHILAGSPKIGKSWLALWLCIQVSKGEDVWNFKTKKSTVLYLCLEDSYRRIQSRIFDITDEVPSTLHFATVSNQIGLGLENQIEDFMNEHKDTKFIVIDTLQKVRSKKGNSGNLYEDDYEDIGAIKKLADKYGIAILVVHHLRKSKDDDPINMISGSSGISGSADTNFVLQKDDRMKNTAKLVCVGRDIESYEFSLEFDKETHIWKQLAPIEVQRRIVPDSINELRDYIKTVTSFTGIASELVGILSEITGEVYNPSTLMKNIIKHSDFLTLNSITYTSNRTFERREFTLSYECIAEKGA